MNLTELLSLLKKLRPFILLGLVGLVLLTLIYLRYFKQPSEDVANPAIKPPQIDKNPTQDQPAAYKFPDTSNLSLPKQLPAYQAKTVSPKSPNYEDLAAGFGITSSPVVINENTHDGKQVIWQQSGASLIISQTNLDYSNYSAPQSGKNLTQPELEKIAAEFIGKIPAIDKTLILDPARTAFLEREADNNPEGELISAASLAGADIVEFSFKKYLSNIPLYSGAPSASYLKIRLDKGGTVVYLSSKLFQDFSASQNFNLKSPEEAIAEVNNRKGIVVDSVLPDQYGNAFELFRTQPFSIGTLDVKTITLGYYLGQDPAQPIQPVYVFTGDFQLPDKQAGKATVFLPAVKN